MFILGCRVLCLVSVCVFGRSSLCLVVSCLGSLCVCCHARESSFTFDRVHYHHGKQSISPERIRRVLGARELG